MHKDSVCLGEPNQVTGWDFKLGEVYCISIGMEGTLNGLGSIPTSLGVYQSPNQLKDQDQLTGRVLTADLEGYYECFMGYSGC